MVDNPELEGDLVSVITPVFNCEKYIAQTIESVLSQTYQNWEMILIDDCSPDNCASIIASYRESDDRIKYVRLDCNSGVAVARNVGLKMAQGKYIALLDGDDFWKPKMLEKVLRRAKDTSADIIYCSYEIVDENGNKLCSDFIVPEKTTFEESIIRSVITCSTVLVTDRFAQIYQFPTNVYHEDIALWFTVLREGCIAFGVVDVLAAYRQGANTRSGNKLKSACRRWAVYRKHLQMPLLQSVTTMLRYAYHGVKKFKRI